MKILLFIGLKIVEISTIVYVPYGIGKLIEKISEEYILEFMQKNILDFGDYYGVGVVHLFMATILLLGLYGLCKLNWFWVKKIMK